MIEWRVKKIPLEIIVLHRLARLRKASHYSATNRYVSFDLNEDNFPGLAAKWAELGEADRISLMYAPRGVML